MVLAMGCLVIQTHSSCCQHMMEDWYLVVCYMDSLIYGFLSLDGQKHMSIHVQLVEYHMLWRHHQHSYHSVVHYYCILM